MTNRATPLPKSRTLPRANRFACADGGFAQADSAFDCACCQRTNSSNAAKNGLVVRGRLSMIGLAARWAEGDYGKRYSAACSQLASKTEPCRPATASPNNAWLA